MNGIACTADTKTAGRCRNTGLPGDKDGFCSQHASLRDHGGEVKVVGMPGVVLLKFNVNPNWRKKLEELGVPVKQRDFITDDINHATHAIKCGRKAYELRPCADSGVQVFGKTGLEGISVKQLPTELHNAGYKLVDTHMYDKQNGAGTVVVLTFALVEGENTELLPAIEAFIGTAVWGHCHLWANPPQDGTVFHTINLAARGEGKGGRELNLNNGLWAVKPYEA